MSEDGEEFEQLKAFYMEQFANTRRYLKEHGGYDPTHMPHLGDETRATCIRRYTALPRIKPIDRRRPCAGKHNSEKQSRNEFAHLTETQRIRFGAGVAFSAAAGSIFP